MRNYSTYLLSGLLVGSAAFVISSCKDDDPPAKPKLSFEAATLTAKESDANLLVNVVLDKPASQDITIDYSLGGTAFDEVSAGTTQNPDYEIVSDYGEVEIKKGETTGTIEINLYSDGQFETTDETIEISIDKVSSDEIEITRDDAMEITVQQEDGMVVILDWPVPSAAGQADMDIILRVGQNTTTWDGVLSGSTESSFEVPEVIFIPKAVTFPAYGMSYTFYDGTLDPLDFTVTFVDFANGAVEPEASWQEFTGQYTIVNKNKWTNVATTLVVQTFVKTGDAFTSFSPITTPASGSRIGSSDNFTTVIERKSFAGNHSTVLKRLKGK